EGLITDLHRFCDQFEGATARASDANLVRPGESPLIVDNSEVRAAHGWLMKAADELRKAIYDNVYYRITIAKTHQRRSMFVVITCSSAAMILTAGMLYFFYGWVFHPIRRLQQGVRHVAAGEFHHPIALKTGDELEELANAFDDMAARI